MKQCVDSSTEQTCNQQPLKLQEGPRCGTPSFSRYGWSPSISKTYSLRRGGATTAYRKRRYRPGAVVDQSKMEAASMAQLYPDLGLQALVQLTLPSDACAPVAQPQEASKTFVALSQ